VVVDGGAFDVLAAGFGREGGEEGSDCLDFWEVAMDLAVFEEVIEYYQ
jgi:hypothetical protein